VNILGMGGKLEALDTLKSIYRQVLERLLLPA